MKMYAKSNFQQHPSLLYLFSLSYTTTANDDDNNDDEEEDDKEEVEVGEAFGCQALSK